MTTIDLPDRLDVDGLSLAVEIRPNRATIEITVERDASLTVKVPQGRTVGDVQDFVAAKRGWIHRQLAAKDALLGPTVTKRFVTGEGFAYLGRSYRLRLVDPTDPSTEVPDVRLHRGRFELRRDRVDVGRVVMRQWYRNAGTAWLRRRLPTWAARFGGLEDVGVRVDELGHRWGSARPGGPLNIHWATMQLPRRLVDYVLVHELTHLVEPNHTAAFWTHVDRVLPDAAARRDELTTQGSSVWLGQTDDVERP